MAIPTQTISMHHIGDVQENIAMGFKAEDFAHLAEMFNALYSDPIAAVTREYSTNAWDSHVLSGNLSPIEITLPTTDNLTFVVQDYGLGMSVDDLRETYSMYGRSDKRGTNAVAGQLGVGSKSGLSYAEGFTVVAVKDHERVSAFVTRDEHGLGVIKILAPPAATDAPNGVRITVPVERNDVHRFREAAAHLFSFWETGSVLIDGNPPEDPQWLATALQLDEHTHIVRNDARLYTSYVVMGNVPYPVADAQCSRISRRFVARLNIGDVDFVPSREDVKHTQHTDATLAALTEHIASRFKHALSTALATTTTRWAETLLKMMWMDRSLSLRGSSDRPLWTFDPTGYGRKAQAHLKYALANVAHSKAVVITGFSAKNISPAARERLVEFKPGTTFVIIPAGVQGIGQLGGRPLVHTWDEVMGNTTKPKADKADRAPKVETQYTIRGLPSMTAAELAEVDDTILYLMPNESLTHGTMGATIVVLYSIAQLPRIKRFVPHIAPYQAEVAHQRKRAQAAITPHDLRIMQAKTLPAVFSSFDASLVHDPELAAVIRLSKADRTDTLDAGRKFACSFDILPLPDFTLRYPLVSDRGYYHNDDRSISAERIFYMNAKYDAAQAETNKAVAS